MITINELADELAAENYKVTPRMIKNWLGMGDMLPQPEKHGGYREGVRLVFPDKNKIKSRIIKICELKGRGFTLSEIKTLLRDEICKDALMKRKEQLKDYVKADGRFYRILRKPYSNIIVADSLRSAWDKSEFFRLNANVLKARNWDGFDEVEQRGLYVTPYLYENQPGYSEFEMYMVHSWMKLRREHDIEWDTQERLFMRHMKKFDKYFYLPDPDNVRFSTACIGFMKRAELNQFGGYLETYIDQIRKGFVKISEGELTISWDFEYKNVDVFIKEFLAGKCAFVPCLHADSSVFLKKF